MFAIFAGLPAGSDEFPFRLTYKHFMEFELYLQVAGINYRVKVRAG
jgi:hypothetical protein